VLEVPKVLWCGHKYCEACIKGLVKMQGLVFEVLCPMCRKTTALTAMAVEGLGTDFDVQEMVRFTGDIKACPIVV